MGRKKGWFNTPPSERGGGRKFSDEEVREIRKAFGNGWNIAQLARKMAVARWTITCIVRNVTYRDPLWDPSTGRYKRSA